MTIVSDSDQKLEDNITDVQPMYINPVANATPAAPVKLTSGTWGFAVPGIDGFDASYTKENSASLNTSTSKWAAVPDDDYYIRQPVPDYNLGDTDSTDIYFAAAADGSIPAGTYVGDITLTVNSEGMERPTSPIVVDKDPVMIPVAYVGSTSSPQWVIADTTNSHIANTVNANGGTYDWYDYDNKIWANAVTVTAGSRAAYLGNSVGTVVTPSDVLGYWVYIPRFRYQTWTFAWSATNYPKAINIEFENCASDGTICTANGYTKSTAANVWAGGVGTWYTHPAFTHNGHELNGFWSGKYESTGTAAAPTSLPDQTPVNNQTIGNMFNGAKNVSNSGGSGAHGLSTTYSDTRIFNSDYWGAIAYLSQSLYGVCTNSACTENGQAANSMTQNNANVQKVWNNATAQCSGAYNPGRTGYGSNGRSDSCIGQTYSSTNIWYTANGRLASTTNNPTGIYDMAGGQWEYVLGVYNNTLNSGTSGISSFDAKYMKNYPNPPLNNNTADIRNGRYNFTSTFSLALGQALFETGGTSVEAGMWNQDHSNSVNSTCQWQERGGHSSNTTTAGIFASDCYTGVNFLDDGSRLLLSRP